MQTNSPGRALFWKWFALAFAVNLLISAAFYLTSPEKIPVKMRINRVPVNEAPREWLFWPALFQAFILAIGVVGRKTISWKLALRKMYPAPLRAIGLKPMGWFLGRPVTEENLPHMALVYMDSILLTLAAFLLPFNLLFVFLGRYPESPVFNSAWFMLFMALALIVGARFIGRKLAAAEPAPA